MPRAPRAPRPRRAATLRPAARPPVPETMEDDHDEEPPARVEAPLPAGGVPGWLASRHFTCVICGAGCVGPGFAPFPVITGPGDACAACQTRVVGPALKEARKAGILNREELGAYRGSRRLALKGEAKRAGAAAVAAAAAAARPPPHPLPPGFDAPPDAGPLDSSIDVVGSDAVPGDASLLLLAERT